MRVRCQRCGRLWEARYPHGIIVCDCYRYCPTCGREMISVQADLATSVYRREDALDPSGAAEPDEKTIRTRLYCPGCGEYSDEAPAEIEW